MRGEIENRLVGIEDELEYLRCVTFFFGGEDVRVVSSRGTRRIGSEVTKDLTTEEVDEGIQVRGGFD